MPLTIDQIVAASSKPPKTPKNDVSMWGRLVVGSDEFAPPEQKRSRARLVIVGLVLAAGLGAATYFLWPRGGKNAKAPVVAAAAPGSAAAAIAPPPAPAPAPPAPANGSARGSAAIALGSAGSASETAPADVPGELTASDADAISAVGPPIFPKKATGKAPTKKKITTPIKKRR